MRILILGITGMLGSKAFNFFQSHKEFETFGTLRKNHDINRYFSHCENVDNIFSDVDALNTNSVFSVIDKIKPEIILNCIGIVKQLKEANNPLISIEVNSLFPHKLANFIKNSKIRLIHISTDCVFSGKKGNYSENDNSDAEDLYGKTKYLGELNTYKNSITIRTSIIGHELKSKLSLLDWFLSQESTVKGYMNAIYSGLTTLELLKIIKNYIIPEQKKYGLYQVSSNPISKYDLLKIISKVYKKKILIKMDKEFKTNKSLNSDRFVKLYSYKKKPWKKMIEELYSSQI